MSIKDFVNAFIVRTKEFSENSAFSMGFQKKMEICYCALHFEIFQTICVFMDF